MFGELFKELRLKNGYSLRSYCRNFDEDPAYISRLERGLIGPPYSQDHLKKMAASFVLNEDSEDWKDFLIKASVSRGNIPESIMSDDEVLSQLPLLLRTVDGNKINSDDISKLIELIKAS